MTMAPNVRQDRSLNIPSIRADFPALHQSVNGRSLVYLDNAATTQKPRAVIEVMRHFYEHHNANVHRGVHALSARATEAFEGAREAVRHYLNASGRDEIIFLRGVTEAINLVAHSFGARFKAGDEVIITALEHHANIVPWHMLRERQGVVLKVLPMDERGVLQIDRLPELITSRTRLVAVNHVSNALGTINPIRQITRIAHEHDVPVLVDGAQGLPHGPVDVQALDVDFYACSGHKAFGPSGIGALYARRELLADMPPFMGGGDMIREVSFDRITYADPPTRFEAGTPNIEGAVGFGAALNYLSRFDWSALQAHERALRDYATVQLREIPGLRIIGEADDKVAVVSFTIEGVHPHDLGTLLDGFGIAIRSGHHCAMPVMQQFEVPGTARASMAFYNTSEEIDRLVEALDRARDMLA
ncbi:MAG: cysteine desulfurase [Halothiobacillaceae bacterium]